MPTHHSNIWLTVEANLYSRSGILANFALLDDEVHTLFERIILIFHRYDIKASSYTKVNWTVE